MYLKEELFCQQRSRECWILKGDANTSYANACANGKRRKTRIYSLETKGGVIYDGEIKNHIVEFYKLFLALQFQMDHIWLMNFGRRGRGLMRTIEDYCKALSQKRN
jgi:hypothetical protein